MEANVSKDGQPVCHIRIKLEAHCQTDYQNLALHGCKRKCQPFLRGKNTVILGPKTPYL